MANFFADKSVVLFGLGKYFFSNFIRLSTVPDLRIKYLCDNNVNMLEKFSDAGIGSCIMPKELQSIKDPLVIITAGSQSAVTQIRNQMKEMNITCYHAEEILSEINTYDFFNKLPDEWLQNRNRKFIDIILDGTTACNFRCEYCYLNEKSSAYTNQIKTSNHSPQEVRLGLSKKRLGGKCFINICASGETMLSEDIIELVYELLDEGHVVSIVTNGTISKKFKELVNFPPELQENLFIKFSFHFLELKTHNLMDVFFNNVEMIRKSNCSYTIEITPHDSLIPYIQEIKHIFETYANGAMPHISFARDASKKDLDVLTSLTLNEYMDIWSQFHSNMFELKSQWYNVRIIDFCYAGNWSCRINLMEGSIQSCYRHSSIGNLFIDIDKPFPIQTIAHGCRMPYCFNEHAYFAFGCVPSISCCSYFDVRDRTDRYGNHWVKQKLGNFIKQKLYDNNYQFAAHHQLIEGIFRIDRPPAFILLNSPDYPNIGDHAIALAVRKFLKALDKTRDIYEITSSHYRNSNIREYIKENDILILTGGGYLGSLWIFLEDTVRNIIINHPNNHIYIFPQSLYFGDSGFGKRERQLTQQIYNQHKMLTICLRDPFSYKLANDIFDDHVKKLFLPDMVLLLDYSQEQLQRSGSLLCLRDDRESVINETNKRLIQGELQNHFKHVEYISNIYENTIDMTNREEAISKFIQKIKTSKVVITDRLHTMLFCTISQTPCLASDNLSKKVFGVYEWIRHLDYIDTFTSPVDIPQKLKNVLNSTTKFDSDRYDAEFNCLRELLREDISKHF